MILIFKFRKQIKFDYANKKYNTFIKLEFWNINLVFYLRFILKGNKQVGEEFHLKLQPQLIRQSS
jgi:hypothetical protein